MAYEQIIYEPGAVARIILNRPNYRNAQSAVLLEEVDAAFTEAENDPSVRVIVLSGNGTSFSAGHDLGTPEELAHREATGYDATDRLQRYEHSRHLFLDLTTHWRNIPKPTIAMVQGYCIFGGWMVASAMDIIFAADDALFLPSHFQWFSVPWDLGARKAKEILYESRFVPAREALDLGFVNRVYPAADLERETLAYAERVAENDLHNLRMIKFSVNDALDRQGFSGSINTAHHTFHVNAGAEGRPDQRKVEGQRQFVGVQRALERLREQQAQQQQ
ncbi:MAG: enoyl-CoA hydratase-related protein [Dehalococcoidia bacterium]